MVVTHSLAQRVRNPHSSSRVLQRSLNFKELELARMCKAVKATVWCLLQNGRVCGPFVLQVSVILVPFNSSMAGRCLPLTKT